MSRVRTDHGSGSPATSAAPAAPADDPARTRPVLLPTDGAGEDPGCSIARTVEVIGDRWTVLILRDAFRGVRRFDDFIADLGVARNLLADRLRKLVEHGVMAKVLYQEHPPRHEYRLTAKGVDLSPALVALMRWGDKYESVVSGPPVEHVHERCGHALDQTFVCWHCAETVTPGAIRSRPGPGARPHHDDGAE